jgi:glycosyltransferase involved in cell wall biosynthesis
VETPWRVVQGALGALMTMRRVALVVPGFEEGGGVPEVALFLERVMRESGRYRSEFVSLPVASNDPSSIRVRAPSTWLRGVRTDEGEWEGHRFTRVGSVWSELEFQRYRPRRPLTALLDRYDLVQIVAGTPSWALVARDVRRPVALQVATLAAEERRALLTRGGSLIGRWRALMTRVTSRIDSSALRHVDAVFVENRWMFDHLCAAIGRSRVIFAPPGIDTERYRPPPDSPASPAYILSVGRFADPRKKVDLLFEAYHRLCATLDEPPRLLLAGITGPSPADWQVAERLGVRERIEFRENVPAAELVELYRNAGLFALSSDEEGLGLAIVEAMACGLPVVSTDCGGPSTSVLEGQTGYLVPRGDAVALASRMHAILTDAELRGRLGGQGRARAVERFSLETTGRLFLEWYDRALSD